MTLDEAIKREELVVNDHNRIKQIKAVTLEECRRAEEHSQLAEWLKDYKRLKEQKPCVNIPFLLHKETGCPLYECVEAYEKAYEYLRSKAKMIG